MNHRVAALALLTLLPCVDAPVAHHSFAAEFDYDLIGTIEGEVVEVLYVNPHARYFIEVADDAGNTVMWDAQSRSPSALQRIGWTRDMSLRQHVNAGQQQSDQMHDVLPFHLAMIANVRLHPFEL